MKSREGFSLFEVLVVVGIAAALVIVVSHFGNNVNGLNGLITNELESKSNVAQSLQIMSNEIRSAQPSAAGAYAIDSAATSSFAFYASVNENGTVDHVQYFLSSSTIYRTIIAPTGTPATYPTSSALTTAVINNVTLVSSTQLFSYYSSSYTGSGLPLTQPITVNTVRLVGINFYSLLVAVSTSTAPAPPQYFSMLVDIRSLNSN